MGKGPRWVLTDEYHFAFADNGEGAPLGANRRVVLVFPTAWCYTVHVIIYSSI